MKDRTMDNVQNSNTYIYIPMPQTYISHSEFQTFFIIQNMRQVYVALCMKATVVSHLKARTELRGLRSRIAFFKKLNELN
jgi:hypothetical protein